MTNYVRELDHMNAAAGKAALGSTVDDVLNAFNALTTAYNALALSHNELRTKYIALVTRLDAASIAGGGNVAAYGPTVGGASTGLSQVGALGTRVRT